MQHKEPQSRAFAGGRPFQHLTVAAGVSESDAGTLADEEVDADSLARAIVDEESLRFPFKDGSTVLLLVFRTMLDPTTCSTGIP
jgi:hypothetical protein